MTNGHNRTTAQPLNLKNGHVAKLGLEPGATLVVDTDSHGPDDLITDETALKIEMGAGLSGGQAKEVLRNSDRFVC